jgi:hypothetical protein
MVRVVRSYGGWPRGIGPLRRTRIGGAGAIAPYLGTGMRYGRGNLTVVVDGLRVRTSVSGWEPNVIIGVRLPRLPKKPWIEWKNSNGLWVVTGGFNWSFLGASRK